MTNKAAGNSEQSTRKLVFVVDDDTYFNQLLSAQVSKIATKHQLDIQIMSFENGNECMEHVYLKPSIILLDFYLDATNDITATAYDLLSQIHERSPETYILVISQQEDWAFFKEDLINSGANDFLGKDSVLEERLSSLIPQII